MKIHEILTEMGVGGVAVVAQPMGSMVSRSGGKKKKNKKKKSTESVLEHIEFQSLAQDFGMEHACQILEDFMLNNDNLYESNTESEVARFWEIQGDNPVVGNNYYGCVLVMTNDLIRIADTFAGKLVKRDSQSYHIKDSSGNTTEYPRKYSGKMLMQTLFFKNKADYDALRSQLSLSHGVDVPPLKENTEVFDTTTTGMPDPDSIVFNKSLEDYFRDYKGWTGELVWMPPSDYIQKCREGFRSIGEPANITAGRDPGRYVDAMRQLMQGDKDAEKFPVLMLDYRRGDFSQEGLHRAMAAEHLGIDTVPVAVLKDAR